MITAKTYQCVFDYKPEKIELTVDPIFKANVDYQKRLRGLTNADLAKMTGYSKGAIDKYMNGYRDSIKVALEIAIALDLLDYIYAP